MPTSTSRAARTFTTRDLVSIAVFAAAWGLVETSLGSYLHTVKVPFTGAILTTLGVLLALTGRTLVPRRGTVLMIGAVTALLKLLSVGSVVLSPLLAILIESVLAEAVLWPFARPGGAAFVAAGAVACLWTVAHPFLTQGILGGTGLLTIYGWVVQATVRAVPAVKGLLWLAIALTVLVPAGLGAAAGLLAHDLGRRLRARLAR
jgi:hypothetical protein